MFPSAAWVCTTLMPPLWQKEPGIPMSDFSWQFCKSSFRLCWGCSKLGSPLLFLGHSECKMLPGPVGFMPPVWPSGRQKGRKGMRAEADLQLWLHISKGLLRRLCNSGASERTFQPTVHSESNCWWHFFTPSSSSERSWQVLRCYTFCLHVGGW